MTFEPIVHSSIDSHPAQNYKFHAEIDLPPMKTAVDLWSNIIAMEVLSPHTLSSVTGSGLVKYI